MPRQVVHLRDDIRKTFTIYALLPVFIISMISIALAVMYWKTNVLERNHESRGMVCEALTTIVSSYMEKETEIAEICDLQLLRQSTDARTKMYQRLYAQVNITHAGAAFYIVDEHMEILIASKAGRPRFLEMSGGAWGILGEAAQARWRAVLGFVSENGRPRDCDMVIAQAIVRDGQIKGYVVFVLPGPYLQQSISNPYVQFVVADRYDYTPIATDYIFSSATVNKVRRELRQADGYFTMENQQYYMSKEDILDETLEVYAITPIGGMVGQFAVAAIILLAVLFILTIIVVIRVKQETAVKTKVIDQLVEAFEAVQRGKMDMRLDIRTNNEFEVIAEAYNAMLFNLKALMRINDEKARATVISEIKQLESQFNPHFLFNTLENIRFMIKLEPTAAAKMIVALSALLRYSINNKIGEVTIREDMEYTKNYLDIQKIRFGERLYYQIYADDTVQECVIPKLIFQPVIENAIKYGASDGGKIRVEIEIWREEDRLQIVVFNSGVGMSEAMLEEVRGILRGRNHTSQHTGLYNVHRRIQLIYGDAYGVRIMSEARAGTTVQIVLPLREEGEKPFAESTDC